MSKKKLMRSVFQAYIGSKQGPSKASSFLLRHQVSVLCVLCVLCAVCMICVMCVICVLCTVCIICMMCIVCGVRCI